MLCRGPRTGLAASYGNGLIANTAAYVLWGSRLPYT